MRTAREEKNQKHITFNKYNTGGRTTGGGSGGNSSASGLVGNVSNMSSDVFMMPTMLAGIGQSHHVADIVTRFMDGSHVGW